MSEQDHQEHFRPRRLDGKQRGREGTRRQGLPQLACLAGRCHHGRVTARGGSHRRHQGGEEEGDA